MPGSLSDYLEGKLADHVFGNTAYTAPATVYFGLFTALPTDAGGGTEVSTSGTNYARVAITNNTTNFPAATTGNKTTGAVITMPQDTGIDWGACVGWGLWDAASAGNLLAWGKLIGPYKTYTADATTDTCTSTAHGFTNGQRVRVDNADGANPGGLNETTDYYIIAAATNTFQLALTVGGAAIDITANGSGTNRIGLAYNQTIVAGNTPSIAAGALNIQFD